MKQSNVVLITISIILLSVFLMLSFICSGVVYEKLLDWDPTLVRNTDRTHVFIFLFSVSFLFVSALILIYMVITSNHNRRSNGHHPSL